MPHTNLAQHIRANVRAALDEDMGGGDLTAQLIAEYTQAGATVITREAAVLCGTLWFEECFLTLDPHCSIVWKVQEGARAEANQTLCEIHGDARALLSAERPALNFLQTLSATATLTRRYVEAVAGTQARILDTRKTLPGLRMAQKYAVKTGGGHNQRIGLSDGVLIKENHIAAAGGIGAVMEHAFRITPPGVPIQIEVETLAQLDEALNAGAKLILLDNFSLADMRLAVGHAAKRAELEASGGITLESVRRVAETGVDRISVGAITHSARALDLTLLVGDAGPALPLGEPLHRRDVVESTMAWARTAAEAGTAAPGAAFLAREQTAGRGRHGRGWTSPAGAGLYLTIVLPGSLAAPALTLAGAVAVAEAAAEVTGVEARVKWPNDLLWQGRKWGGVLAESAGGPERPVVLLGVGVNVRETGALPPDAVSLEAAAGAAPDAEALLSAVLARLGARLAEFAARGFAGVADAYASRSALAPGDRVAVEGAGEGPSVATVAGIDPEGRLLLEGFPAPVASATIRRLRRAAS
jgi:nicotinate-nucleotide pyrophosphorylase (carboxylating)